MSTPVVLILGAGPGIGAQCISHFSKAGYRVAAAARRFNDRKIDSVIELHVDLAKPETIPQLFDKVKQEVGIPSVVVYNAAVRTLVSPDDPLSTLSVDDYNRDLNVNLTSVFIAAKEAIAGFKQLPDSVPKTFIFSGNKLNVMSDPKTLSFGICRTGVAHMLWDCSNAYRHQGYKFYYTAELFPDGRPAREAMDPGTRAQLYLELSQDEERRPWHYTYVKGTGYVDFRSVDKPWDV